MGPLSLKKTTTDTIPKTFKNWTKIISDVQSRGQKITGMEARDGGSRFSFTQNANKMTPQRHGLWG